MQFSLNYISEGLHFTDEDTGAKRQSSLPKVPQPIRDTAGCRTVSPSCVPGWAEAMSSSFLLVDSLICSLYNQTFILSMHSAPQPIHPAPSGTGPSSYLPALLGRFSWLLLTPCHHSLDLPSTLRLAHWLASWAPVLFRVLWHSAPQPFSQEDTPGPPPPHMHDSTVWSHCILRMPLSQCDIP